MQPSELRQIAAWLQAADVHCIEIGRRGESIRMTMMANARAPTEPAIAIRERASAASAGGSDERTNVAAESAGVFLKMHPLRTSPFVRPGDRVKQGDIVGLLRIARIYTPVAAPVDGIVTEVFAEHESLVGFGTPLMAVRPALPLRRGRRQTLEE